MKSRTQKAMKRIGMIMLLVIAAEMVNGQETYEVKRSRTDSTKSVGAHPVGWVRQHILDSWMISIQGGGQLYYGFEDREGAFMDRLTANGELYVGRWMFPMFGYRVGGGYGYAHGFITKESYTTYAPTYVSYGTSYGTAGEGNALGGYYWPVDDDNGVYMQKWKYVYGGGDLMLNLSYLRPYNRINLNRRWQNVLYGGVTIRMGLSENHPELQNESNLAAEGHVGWISKVELSRHWEVYSDMRLSIVEGRFDRELVPQVEKTSFDMIANWHVGVNYCFNLRSEKKRREYYVAKRIVPAEMTEMPKFAFYMQIEELNMYETIDSLWTMRQYHRDSPEVDKRIKELEEEVAKLEEEWKKVPENAELGDILGNNRLPYIMVFFDLDRWDIRAEDEMKLAKIARLIKTYPEYEFMVTGSADMYTGTAQRNVYLSHNRADVVYNRLVNGYGVDAKQLKREYLGGIGDYEPFQLNRATVVIMKHPAVKKAFEEMRSHRRAGDGMSEDF